MQQQQQEAAAAVVEHKMVKECNAAVFQDFTLLQYTSVLWWTLL